MNLMNKSDKPKMVQLKVVVPEQFQQALYDMCSSEFGSFSSAFRWLALEAMHKTGYLTDEVLQSVAKHITSNGVVPEFQGQFQADIVKVLRERLEKESVLG